MDEIRERVAAIRATPEFSECAWWLTFYLNAEQGPLERLATRLSELGAVNLDGAEGGFLYPELPVQSEPDAVIEMVTKIRALADDERVEVLSVDVDTSVDVNRSNFVELVRF
jgi:hypothetical protein